MKSQALYETLWQAGQGREEDIVLRCGDKSLSYGTLFQGILQAEAVSARPLTEEETLALTARLERVTGRPVILRRRTEAGLLGGMWVEIEGHRMEDTLRGRLTDVERMWTKWS